MFVCATLVNDSTKERAFKRRKETNDQDKPSNPVHYVVQPGNQVVGDQTFDPFLFSSSAKSPFTNYMTSWKAPSPEIEKMLHISQKGRKLFQKPSDKLLVLIATFITIFGFVLQFVGLRSIHSLVSLLQLAVTLLMSIIRALLRTQRLGIEQNLFRNRPDEVSGYELDWLALRIGKDANQPRHFWGISAGIPAQKLQPSSSAITPRSGPGTHTNGQKRGVPRSFAETAYRYRSRLAELTEQSENAKSRLSNVWDNNLVSGRLQAQRLSRAIEESFAIFSAHGKVKKAINDTERWGLNASVWEYTEGGQKALTHYCVDDLLSMPNSTCKANESRLEAILGLWSLVDHFRPMHGGRKFRIQDIVCIRITNV